MNDILHMKATNIDIIPVVDDCDQDNTNIVFRVVDNDRIV